MHAHITTRQWLKQPTLPCAESLARGHCLGVGALADLQLSQASQILWHCILVCKQRVRHVLCWLHQLLALWTIFCAAICLRFNDMAASLRKTKRVIL